MKQIIWKAYWDYEKEERWINEMSAMGLAMTDYSWCRYAFTEAPKNEYTYRIELLKHAASHPESMAYIRFLEENGVECIATYWRWVYLRKKTAEGPFDIYSDKDSKIAHYKRVFWFETAFMCLELTAGIVNLVMGIVSLSTNNSLGNAGVSNVILGSGLTLLGLLFLKLSLAMGRKIRKLQKEKIVRE